jgi:hypothetical protein
MASVEIEMSSVGTILQQKGQNMTTENQELKQCHLNPCRCGFASIKWYTYKKGSEGNRWDVKCADCGTNLKGFHSKAEAVAFWNSYVAPAGQWNDEVPTKMGWYWVTCHNSTKNGYCAPQALQVVTGAFAFGVKNYEGSPLYVHHRGRYIHMEKFTEKFTEEFKECRWLPMDVPPLPGEDEEDAS